MVSKFLPITLAVIHLSFFVSAQSETEIKKVIATLFEGMHTGDSAKVHQTLDAQCVLQTVLKKKTGETVVVTEPVQHWLDEAGKPLTIKLEERLLSYDIKQDREMAMAWTPYQLYVNDKKWSCGVNVFLLAHRGNGWRIISITDTRRKDCD